MTEPTSGEHRLQQVGSLGVMALLLLGLALFVVRPKAAIAEHENRALATWPALTMTTVMDGRFAKDVEAYVADHFPYRAEWLQLSDWVTKSRGVGTPEIQFFADRADPEGPQVDSGASIVNVPATVQAESPAESLDVADRLARDSTAANAPLGGASEGTSTDDDAAYQRANSLILYRKRAIQAFRVPPDVVTRYARVLEQWATEVGPSVRLYMMPVPIGSDFYLPREVKGEADHERLSIDRLFATMPSRVVPVRVYEELAPRRAEAIYFRTDHHWTGRGAYYGYQAFTKAAQLEPLPWSALTVRSCNRFLGSLYSQTRSPVLGANPDTVEVPMIGNRVQVRQLLHDQRTWQRGALYLGCRGYQSFLGLDYPLMTFESDVANGRRILVIKDSYGNAFAPFLAAHYEKVWVVDYRYYAGSVLRLIEENAIDAVVFVHNIQVLNSPYIRRREIALLRGGTPLSIAPKPAPGDSAARPDTAGRPPLP
jgi:hypothetical protein